MQKLSERYSIAPAVKWHNMDGGMALCAAGNNAAAIAREMDAEHKARMRRKESEETERLPIA